jgi:hypothetical protein
MLVKIILYYYIIYYFIFIIIIILYINIIFHCVFTKSAPWLDIFRIGFANGNS